MDMRLIISQMVVLFLLLAVGYVLGKKALSSEADKLLTRLVLGVTVPCTILNSVMNSTIEGSIVDAAFFMLMTVIFFAIAHLITIPSVRLLRGAKKDRGVYACSATFGNVGFMGFPATYAIFGAASAFYVALLNMPFTLLMFSVGTAMIAGSGKKINFKILLNPAMIAAYLSILIFATGFQTPIIIADAVGIVSGITTPVSMIVIGSTLAKMPIKDLFSDWRIYPVTLLKLIVIPVVTWLVLRQFITNELMLGVLVVLSGMPTAATATMLAVEHGGNEKTASAVTFLTTLLSCVTIPLTVFLLLS
ncbi:MAG: AEC family transporter [Oscillospiraceae bacterium]|nr:AEC family transporter [Oscillospiraceae bacterium]